MDTWADTLVKKAAMLPNYHKSETSYHSSKLCINKKMKEQYLMSSETNNATKPWKTSIHSTTRQEAAAKFRLQTGHDILAKHLSHFRIQLLTPTCKIYNLEEDMDSKPTALTSPSQYMRDRKILRSHDHDDESDGQLTICVNILCH